MPEKKNKLLELIQSSHTMWIGIVVLTSVWMFILGIFVGRGTAPVKFDIQKLQKELIALKETVIKEEEERFRNYSESAQNKTNLEFYEELKTPERVQQPRSGVAELSPGRQEDTRQQRVDMSRTSSSTAADKGTGYTIQISSLRDSAAADRMVADLKKQGYENAFRTIGKIPGKGIWYRVRVGNFKSRAEAERYMARLRDDKYNPFLIRP